jgi:hypothetical protein
MIFSMRKCSLVFFALLLIQCSSVYYGAMEKLGYHKRDILATRVKDARDSQKEAKEQFKSALQRFKEVVNFKGGELEARYNSLNAQYEKSKTKAEEVSKRIDDVEDVGNALFKEWKNELKEYSNDNLRSSSEKKLELTKAQFEILIGTMKKAEEKIGPVLSVFKDQVLFLKHNLNATAIASLDDESAEIQSNVSDLVEEMDKSIDEANRFIASLGNG